MKKILSKLISNFFKIFKMDKSIVSSKLNTVQNNLDSIRRINTEIKNAEVSDPFLIDMIEREIESFTAVINKMKELNDFNNDMKYLRKF